MTPLPSIWTDSYGLRYATVPIQDSLTDTADLARSTLAQPNIMLVNRGRRQVTYREA